MQPTECRDTGERRLSRLSDPIGYEFDGEQVQAIEERKQYLVVFRDVEYVDVFNATHRTEVCFMNMPVVRTMGTCPQHYRMN